MKKGWGCTKCRARTKGEIETPYAYIKVPGFDGIPSHEEIKKVKGNIYIELHCSQNKVNQIDMTTNSVSGIQYHFNYIQPVGKSKYIELPCFNKVKNCALCGGINPSKCKICLDQYVLNSFITSKNSAKAKEQVCIFKFCPPGFRRVVNFNGIEYCEPCKIEHCN